MIEILQSDFITAGRARGLSENKLTFRHALRNTFIPIMTLIGLQFAILMAGAVLTETTFSWPGMGRYLVDRIELRDYTAVQSTIAVFALFVAGISLLMDVLYAFVDPRIRY
jgi:peptide/nickel transport system permease protein